jgi:two-component system nitrogen regulation sensor histidine kinase NtrY
VRLAFTAAGAATLALALWLRNPLIPYGGDTGRASVLSRDSTGDADVASRRAQATGALASAVSVTQRKLGEVAASALQAPSDPERAFDYLRSLPLPPKTGVVVMDGPEPLAWAGELRDPPVPTAAGTTVVFSPFYVTLQVVAVSAQRRAIASVLVHAEPPADRIAAGIDDPIARQSLAGSFRFGPPSDTAAGELISGVSGNPLMRVDATPLSTESLRFATSAVMRVRGAILLGVAILGLMILGWFDRQALGPRILAIGFAIAAVAVVPWNNFSNFARVFDPAYFYSSVAGPLTATAGAFAMFAALLLLGVIALIRARRSGLNRAAAGAMGFALLAAGIVFTELAAQGIALPPWGATVMLWLEWQLPLFLLLFAFWMASSWLLRIASGRKAMVPLRTGAAIALICGAITTFVVWTKTTEQRLQLAMRDVAGLQRIDGEAAQLLSRFGAQLSVHDEPGTRADLLKRYAISDLAAAELQVSLGTWSVNGAETSQVDLAPLEYDSTGLSKLVREAIDSGAMLVRQTLGPTGRQVILVVPHGAGGATSAVVSPRTRLIAQNPYTALLGFDQPDKTEPPYTLTLADVTPGGGARSGTMTWRRIGNEWHGDEILMTSAGPARAHVEVDLRTWPTRIVRAALIVIFDVAVAGILWALGAMAEGGFFRWLRRRTSAWRRSYRGRLSLALFAFFVIPAVGFATWSFQRLQRDDRGVRELLVREVLNTAVSVGPARSSASIVSAGTPLFLYSEGILVSSSDSLYEMIAPAGRLLPRRVYASIDLDGELTATSRQTIAGSTMFWGYRAGRSETRAREVFAAPARSDELTLDRRRRDITLLVLFATAVGAIAAFWLSGIAARILARDLELSRIEVARAERVLAWGEMARQIAHEIKNPLTPIRLGVQHLRRARTDPGIDFDRVLDENVTRILSEIDRLDRIARTFSRYGSAPADLPLPDEVDVAAILRDVLGLERMGAGGVTWTLDVADAVLIAKARAAELRDVLLNVFENARLARARNVRVSASGDARSVRITIIDDGTGIAQSALPRVFEPHFSTRTTGSGLGLAISRRLLESWGGNIDIESHEGMGTRVLITLQSGAA